MYFYCYVYVFLLLCVQYSVYSVSLCCFVCKCVCTTATGCQPNCGKQIYQFQYAQCHQIEKQALHFPASTSIIVYLLHIMADDVELLEEGHWRFFENKVLMAIYRLIRKKQSSDLYNNVVTRNFVIKSFTKY
jgi:hypothetical protein